MARPKTTGKCRNPTCEKPRHCRGLCETCYAGAWRAVKGGQTTWSNLEATEKVLPTHTRGKLKGWLLDR